MKKLVFIITVILFSISAKAQIIDGEDGLYYDENKNLYSGIYTEFFETGQKRIELSLQEGMKDGKTILYAKNGHQK